MSHISPLIQILVLSALISLIGSARILCIYPVPFHSHQSVFQVLTEELARNGHELVVLTPMPHKEPIENVTEIDVQEMSNRMWEKGYAEATKEHPGLTVSAVNFWKDIVYVIMPPIVDAQFSAPEMKAIIDDENSHFDVILTEAAIPAAVMIAARFDAPIIQVSSFLGTEDNFVTVGAATHPLIFPEYKLHKTWNLSLWDKFYQLYVYFRLKYLERTDAIKNNRMLRKHFGENAPSLEELTKNVQMLFLNVHHIWDNHRPVSPAVVYMGALHLREPKPIPKALKSYLDSSKNGVVYMSLGSKLQFSGLPLDTISLFFRVFATLPYDVILKWDGGEAHNKPDNVHLEKWLPQNDVLRHPKIKVFITQCGLQSTDEAIDANVPLVGLPIFADQFYNAQKYLQLGIGKQLDIESLSERDLREAIMSVAEDQSYRANISSLSRIMSEQRAGGLQRAVYWTEYVARHGARHLRSPLADATLVDYYMLDVLAAALAALALAAVAIVYIITLILARVDQAIVRRRKLKDC